MPRSLPTDLRWRVVFKLLYDEKTFDQVAQELSAGPLVVDPRWVRRMWDLFCEAGDVADVQGQRFAEPANKKLSMPEVHTILDLVLNIVSAREGLRPSRTHIIGSRWGGKRQRARQKSALNRLESGPGERLKPQEHPCGRGRARARAMAPAALACATPAREVGTRLRRSWRTGSSGN